MKNLDILDRRLIYELDRNARQSIAAVARKLRVSRNVALYRLHNLKEQGIIKHAFAEINSISLGYLTFRVFLKIGNCTPEQRRAMEEHLLGQKNLTWFSKCLGKWDLDFLFTTKDIWKFERFREEFFLQFNSVIEEHHTSVLKDIRSYPKDHIVGRTRDPLQEKNFGTKRIEIDGKDEALLRVLSRDAMRQLIDIARDLDLSVNTAKRRMKRLEKEGVILQYRLFLDTKKLGFGYYKLHVALRNYAKEDLTSIREFLASKPFIPYTDHYVNGEDFEIECQLRNEREYVAFVAELESLFGHIIKDKFLIKFHEELLFRYLPESD